MKFLLVKNPQRFKNDVRIMEKYNTGIKMQNLGPVS